MKREILTSLVAAAARTLGYTFRTGEDHTATATVREYPAAWLSPPVVADRTGRREGITTWRVALHLMALPEAGTGIEGVWQALEADALAVARTLAEVGEVCSVAKVECAPHRQGLTAHGEASVTLSCDVSLWYYC
jgi:hypothetical protein